MKIYRSRPPQNDEDDDEDLEQERPVFRLIAAIAWIGTRNPEYTRQIEADEWNQRLDESRFTFSSDAADAWTQLRRHLAVGTISATGISYLVPDGFDPANGGWSATGGGFQSRINPGQLLGHEIVNHSLAPYSALRPSGVILTGMEWYRDVQIDAIELQANFPEKRQRNRKARKTDAATRVYGELFPTPESQGKRSQLDRLDLLNKRLEDQEEERIALSSFKVVEKLMRLKKA
jgi:hypothetical protein